MISRPEFDVKTPLQALNSSPLDTRSESNRADIRNYLIHDRSSLFSDGFRPSVPAIFLFQGRILAQKDLVHQEGLDAVNALGPAQELRLDECLACFF